MSSAISINLDESKILSSGKGLTRYLPQSLPPRPNLHLHARKDRFWTGKIHSEDTSRFLELVLENLHQTSGQTLYQSAPFQPCT